MLGILGLIGNALAVIPGCLGFAERITGKVFDAKVAITTARIGGDRDVAVALVKGAATTQAGFYTAMTQSKALMFLVVAFALPWIGYEWKTVLVDNVLCPAYYGSPCSTPAIHGQVGEWGTTIILSIFGSGTSLALGNMWFNRKAPA